MLSNHFGIAAAVRQLLQRELEVLQDICFSMYKKRCKTFASAGTRAVARRLLHSEN